MSLNYLGVQAEPGDAPFAVRAQFGPSGNQETPRRFDVNISAGLEAGRAVFRWRFSPLAVSEAAIRAAGAHALIEFTALVQDTSHTPGAAGLAAGWMDSLYADLSRARGGRQ